MTRVGDSWSKCSMCRRLIYGRRLARQRIALEREHRDEIDSGDREIVVQCRRHFAHVHPEFQGRVRVRVTALAIKRAGERLRAATETTVEATRELNRELELLRRRGLLVEA